MKKIIVSSILIGLLVCFTGCVGKNGTNTELSGEKVHSEENMYQFVEKNKVILSNNEREDVSKIKPDHLENYFSIDANSSTYFVEDSEGELFGYEERHWDGCSSWCSVWEYDCKMNASSTLAPQGKFSYDAANLTKETRDCAWVEGVDGDGIGEYIEVKQLCQVGPKEEEHDIAFNEICIVNGYTATMKNWVENSRVRELK